MKINRSFTKLNNAKITSFSLTLNSDFHLPKKVGFICFNENPLKMMKNAFYFIIKVFLVLKLFKLLCWHGEKAA